MKLVSECTIGIVGLGLMGGAFALALRKRCGVGQKNLLACARDTNTLQEAEKAEILGGAYLIDHAGDMLVRCDLVFICLYPAAALEFLKKWEHSFKHGALISDIAGIKEKFADAALKIRSDVDFIPGHPMAGFEKGGFNNASRVNFSGRNYILCPIKRNKPENLQFLKDLILQMGFGRITEIDACGHDSKIAYTSQLCHVLAASLIDCGEDTGIARFGGGSFEDFTRIAMLNAPMWTELFLSNKKALLDCISQFEASLNGLKTLILENRAEELELKLAAVRDKRIAIDCLRPGT